MELPTGKGFADVVYLPRRDVEKPALIIELKWKKSAEGAVRQIKERNYTSWIGNYTGDILLVGINYDEKKGHECVIERYQKNECTLPCPPFFRIFSISETVVLL